MTPAISMFALHGFMLTYGMETTLFIQWSLGPLKLDQLKQAQ